MKRLSFAVGFLTFAKIKAMSIHYRQKNNNITDLNPDQSGFYIDNPLIEVDVWVNYSGRCHGSDDYYEVFIKSKCGKFTKRFTEIYSQIPTFIVDGKPFYKGK